MKTEHRIHLEVEEPGDDPLSDQVMDVLRSTLQPDSETSLDAAVEQITELLPKGRPYSTEVASFAMTCYEAAEQIPHTHPSMIKLITVLDCCLNSPRVSQDGPRNKYQMLGETLRDCWNSSSPAEDPIKFVNFQTFAARLFQHGIFNGPDLGIWTIHEAFRKEKGRSEDEQNAYMKAACQWLLLQGGEIHAEIGNGYLKLKDWKRWHQQLDAIAIDNAGRKDLVYDEETVDLAGRAVVTMQAIEGKKAIYDRSVEGSTRGFVAKLLRCFTA